MPVTLGHFDQDPSYGSGLYRRDIRLRFLPGVALATVDDTHHSMWVVLRYRNQIVVSVDAGIQRGPATSCGGAPAKLGSVIGMPITAPLAEIAERLPPSDNCTHLADLLRWALSGTRAGASATDYAIVVPDQIDEPVWIEIRRDKKIVHRWCVDRDTIIAPARFAGLPLLKGFLAWARDAFDAEHLEAAVMLQRGAWVARGRRYVVDRSIIPLRAAAGMQNACHSYSGANWATATNNIGYVRDFSSRVERAPLPALINKLLEKDSHEDN